MWNIDREVASLSYSELDPDEINIINSLEQLKLNKKKAPEGYNFLCENDNENRIFFLKRKQGLKCHNTKCHSQ